MNEVLCDTCQIENVDEVLWVPAPRVSLLSLVGEARRKIGAGEWAYYRWRRGEGGTIGRYEQVVEYAIKRVLFH